MNIALSFLLQTMAVTTFLNAIGLFRREKNSLNKIVFYLSVGVTIWCSGYAWMTLIEDETYAYIARSIGVFGIFCFLPMMGFFCAEISGSYVRTKKRHLYLQFLAGVIIYPLFIARDSIEFTITSYGTSFYANHSLGRVLEALFIAYCMVYSLTSLHSWYKRTKLKRELQIIRCLLGAGAVMTFGAVFDTLFPLLGLPSFPGSCFGGFVAMMTFWWIAGRYNAFSITRNNLLSYVFDYANMAILLLNDRAEIELANDFANRTLEIDLKKHPVYLSDLFDVTREDCLDMVHGRTRSNVSNLLLAGRGTMCNVSMDRVLDNYGQEICTICFVADMSKEYEAIREMEEIREELKEKLEDKTSQVERVTLQAITTVANTIDAKDEYTKGHSVRVAEYSAAIAEELGWEKEQIQNIRYVALLHDIGKIGVPDSVLNKPGKLTEQEFNLVKEHTIIGAEILKDIAIVDGLDVGAKYHHERYDGNGYPCGLAGRKIPEVARIIGIADAYDAMASNRIYRRRLTDEQVYEELEKNRGLQFDPVFLDVFLKMLREGYCCHVETMDCAAETDSLIEESNRLIQIIVNGQSEQTKREAETDYLTGIYNRRGIEKKIAASLIVEDGCLMVIDLDNFKQVNDIFGHLAGDEVIIMTAQIFKDHASNALIGRIGGDEFVFYLKGVTTEAEVEPIIDGIFYTFRNRAEEQPSTREVTISVGLALSSEIGRDYNSLFSGADKALYLVKQNGKSSYAFYHDNRHRSEENESTVDLLRIVEMIRKQGAYKGAFKAEYREFTRVYDLLSGFAKRNDLQVRLILFTLKKFDGSDLSTEEQENVMYFMEKSILASLRAVDIGTRYSSRQYIVALANCDFRAINGIRERILKNFFKMYDKRDIILDYDVAAFEED